MFDSEKLKVGDVFYSVKERNQAFHRKKIHQEIDGEDWFKYDTPAFEEWEDEMNYGIVTGIEFKF